MQRLLRFTNPCPDVRRDGNRGGTHIVNTPRPGHLDHMLELGERLRPLTLNHLKGASSLAGRADQERMVRRVRGAECEETARTSPIRPAGLRLRGRLLAHR